MEVLLLHGNGGAGTRFRPFMERVGNQPTPGLHFHVPELPGFEGRPLPQSGTPSWDPFILALIEHVAARPDVDWVFYGHGIGGSMLLEWASRKWEGAPRPPRLVVLHSCIGASLEKRWFPKIMRWPLIRELMKRLITAPWLEPVWTRRLFLQPEAIPEELRRQFFEDYRRCEAFSVFFDLITPAWYQTVQKALKQSDFHFLWGGAERVVAAKYVDLWRRDFPNATFEIIPEWDHFPMLDHPDAFFKKIHELLAFSLVR